MKQLKWILPLVLLTGAASLWVSCGSDDETPAASTESGLVIHVPTGVAQ